MGLMDIFKSKSQKAFEQQKIVDLGQAAYSEKKYDEALNYYKKALEICDNFRNGEEFSEPINQAFIGEILCYLKLNQPDNAKKALKLMYFSGGRPDYNREGERILLDAGLIEQNGVFTIVK